MLMTKRSQSLKTIKEIAEKYKKIEKKKIKILVPIGCRSDEGLSKPIIKRLRENPKFECLTMFLVPANFKESYDSTDFIINRSIDKRPDLILITGDRIEMTASACAAFHNNIKIAHIGGGITNKPLSTLDDINRHCITLWSDLVFCENRDAVFNVKALWHTIKKATNHYIGFNDLEKEGIYLVGITHLDDLEIDESLVPDEPFDLVLYNPITKKDDFLREKLHNEMLDIDAMLDKYTLIMKPNPDPNNNLDHTLNHITTKFRSYDNLPRSQFFGLLQKCERFITNSSCAYYEAPHFLKPEQIILIGKRNIERSSFGRLVPGASDKIVKILEDYFNEKEKGS